MSRQHGSTESVGAPRGVRKQVSHGFLDILGLPKLQNCPELRGPRLEGLLPPVPHGILDILKPRGALFCLRFRGTRAVHARAPLAYGAADPSTRPWTRGPWFRRASQQNSRQSGVCTTRGPSNSDPTLAGEVRLCCRAGSCATLLHIHLVESVRLLLAFAQHLARA